jgi:hypothetical protein
VTLNDQTPTLSSVGIASNNSTTTLAKVADVVTLTFTASETIATPVVTFQSGGAAIQDNSITYVNTSGNIWTAAYTTESGDTTGSVTYSIAFSDSAGNAGTAVTGGSVTFDKTAPTITSFTSTTNDGNYILAASVNITATASEDVVSGNTITATLDTGDTVLLTAAANGTTLVGTYTVGTGDNSNDLTVSSFSIGTVTDIVGNAMASTTVPSTNIASGSAIVIDALAPTALLISCEISSCYGIFERQSITVQSTETGTAYVVQTGGSGRIITTPPAVAINLASLTSANNNRWNSVAINSASTDTTLPLTDLEEGIYRVYAVDALGNVSTASVGTGGLSSALGSLDVKTE